MTPLALLLVLASALAHATWNLFAKRAGGGAPFVWLFGTVSVALYAPLALAALLLRRPELGPAELGFIAGSGALHLAYFLTLQRGYRSGDLSLVYPLARGTGPLLSTLAAILLLGERPSALALCGAGLVVTSVFLLAGGAEALRGRGGAAARSAVLYGLGTGALIASYTLWDKRAVGALLIPPLVLDWGANLVRALLLTPAALRRRDEVRRHWREHRTAVLAVAVLSPLAYILVLVALSFSPVSYVAPAREIGILFGAVLGARLLGEGDARRRLAAASLMVLGVAALALG